MLESKYIIFFAGSAFCVPLGILFASASRRFLDFVFIILVFGTCMYSGLFGYATDINFLSREWYRGTTRGIEISYLDLLAVILLAGSLVVRRREGKPFYWPPSLGLLLAYFAWCFLSVAVFSDPKIFGLFELTKVARAILVFLAVVAYIRSPREIHLLVWTLAGTICYEGFISLRDRYIYGFHRIRGTLGHPNSLSMYALQILPVLVAGYFSRDTSKWLKIACIAGVVATAGCVILSISRMGFVVLVIISAAAFILCTGLKLNARNLGMALLGLLLVSGMVARSYDTVLTRLGGVDITEQYLSEEGDRGAYFRRAGPAIANNPIAGVGLNNWSWWITNRYSAMAGLYETNNFQPIIPYSSTDAEPANNMAQLAPAHNLYLLVVTELGIPGLLIFLALLMRWLYMNGIAVLNKNEGICTRLRVGLALSLLAVMLSSWTEWNFKHTENYFLGHVLMAAGAILYYNRPQADRR